MRAIVVLPFTNLSTDPENEYLADGLSEELMFVLERIPGLHVASRTASFYFKRQSASLSTIGSELNVNYALEGSVRQIGDTIRVTAKLVRIADARTLFSEVFERQTNKLLDLPSDLAFQIVNELAMNLSESDLRTAASAGTDSEKAFSLLLQAREHARKDNAEDLKKAVDLMQAAIEEDPQFLQAYQMLGTTLMQASSRTGESVLYRQKLVDLGRRYDDQFSDTLNPILGARRFVDRDWPAVEAGLAMWLQAAPEAYQAYELYGYLLANAGLFEASLSYNLAASRLAPFEPRPIEQVGDMYQTLNQFDDAIQAFRQCQVLTPERSACFAEIGIALYLKGDTDAARAHLGNKASRRLSCG